MIVRSRLGLTPVVPWFMHYMRCRCRLLELVLVLVLVRSSYIISISIKINDDPPQPLNARFSSQKNSKYRGVAEQNGFEFMPFVFSHNGQIHPETVSFICRQIEAT